MCCAGKPPLYFQHDGHSRTIIGIERYKPTQGKAKRRAESSATCSSEGFLYNLLLLDPSHKTNDLVAAFKTGKGWQVWLPILVISILSTVVQFQGASQQMHSVHFATQPACFRLYARWPAVVPLMVSNIFKRAVVNLFCHNAIQGVNMDRENKDLNPSPLVFKTSFMNPRSRTDFWLTKCDACAEALQARDPRPQVAAVPAAVCR